MATLQKPAISPRKKPVQARSQATVDAILEATARVLCDGGYDRASTNRIADKAGVSIGSLYQYFPSKESLVGALIDRHSDEMLAVFLRQVAAVHAAPVHEAVRAVVSATVDAHLVEPKLHRIFEEQVPRIGKLAESLERLDTHASDAVRAYLVAHADELRVKDLETSIFVIVHAVEALVHRAVFVKRGPSRDALVEAVVDMVTRFLTDAPPPAR
jgi:AcrR family transcriptional regulator